MRQTLSFKRTIFALLLFGTAFGYLEAAVVSYLRLLHEPAVRKFYPGRAPGDLFPLLTLEQLRASGADQQHTLFIELGRETATIVMLAGIAFAIARNAGQWAAAFVVAFGVWDIAFYLFLKLLLNWPASLFTWDILFLVPVPWVGPVLSPVLVSAVMIAAGIWHLRRESQDEPVRIGSAHWIGLLAGALIIVISFAEDYRNTMSGRMPNPFDWGLFALGLTLGTASYGLAARRSMRTKAAALVQTAEAAWER